jgi:ATP-dependent RNA helicase DHX29
MLQYAECGEKTRKSLARLNESVIDYDLVETLLQHIHETQPPGAILVFMPGIREVSVVPEALCALC